MAQTDGEISQGIHTGPLPVPGRQTAFVDIAICIVLILFIFAIYAQVSGFEFITADDDLYVVDNAQVKEGLTPDSIKWAFTGTAAANWIPVTLLTHMLDVQLFGLESGRHHLMNVVFHAIATLLLFVSLKRATHARWASAFVAAIFALHPLHVESVAWISERKDVLGALFWFLTLYCYIRYTEQPTLGRYFMVLGSFCLGLMSKPVLVTLPFTLLLFDFWPLRRLKLPQVLWEKMPLLGLAVIDSVVTWLVQSDTGAFFLSLPLSTRIATSLSSYGIYLWQTIWPVQLASFYPYPRNGPNQLWTIASVVILLAVSGFAITVRRTRPYCLTGWFWFLGTLVPMIGLVQVGLQSHADRYTYIPMVGLAMMVAWAAGDLVRTQPRIEPFVAAAAVGSCVLLGGAAWIQAGYWRNCETLYHHAIEATHENAFAETSLGAYLIKKGRKGEALAHLETAVRICPDCTDAQYNMGLLMANAGLCDSAIPHFEAAVRADPRFIEGDYLLGRCLVVVERYQEAIPHLEKALAALPSRFGPHFNLGRTFSRLPGRQALAIYHYEAAINLRPDSADAQRELGMLLANLGLTTEAIRHLEAAHRISPDPDTLAMINRLRANPKP